MAKNKNKYIKEKDEVMSERQEQVREREGKRGGNREAERVGEAQVR